MNQDITVMTFTLDTRTSIGVIKVTKEITDITLIITGTNSLHWKVGFNLHGSFSPHLWLLKQTDDEVYAVY
jgi:hypothetical protein